MERTENIYYGLGLLAYAVAKSDGKVQLSEMKMMEDIVLEGTKSHSLDFNLAEIIFRILEGEDMDVESSYNLAMKTFRGSSYYFTDELKKDFITIIEKVAMAYHPVTDGENKLVQKFREDLMTVSLYK